MLHGTVSGTVREWWHDEGWGVVDSAATPGGCWAHYSAVLVPGYRTLAVGQEVLLEAEPAEQDGYRWTANRVWPAEGWSTDAVLEAVRRSVSRGLPDSGVTAMDAELVAGDLWVTFDWPGEADRLGLRFPLSEVPVGPCTDEVCASPSEWATDVWIRVTEELETGLTRRALRSVTELGFVELHHRAPDSGTLRP